MESARRNSSQRSSRLRKKATANGRHSIGQIFGVTPTRACQSESLSTRCSADVAALTAARMDARRGINKWRGSQVRTELPMQTPRIKQKETSEDVEYLNESDEVISSEVMNS